MTARKREHNVAPRRGRGSGKPFTSESGRLAALRRHTPGRAPASPENMAQTSLQAMMARESTEGGGRSRTVLRLLREDALDQMALLLAKTREALESLDPARAGDHRALASTLVVLSERLDQGLAAEGGGPGGGESYEERLARAYREQGLPVPGRLAMTLRGQGASPNPVRESPQDTSVEDTKRGS